MRVALLVVVVALSHSVVGLSNLRVVHKWKAIDFDFPSGKAREESIRRGEFVPGNAVPLDVDVWMNDGVQRIFVTFPKFKGGIPVTLATVSDRNANDSPVLTPFPDWQAQKGCDGLTSVFRTQIDQCGRLWVIDSGMVNLSVSGRRECQPQLVAFNLKTNQFLGKHQFADDLMQDGSILANLAVDVRGDKCGDTFVYVADVTGYALLVFDMKNQKSWKAQSNTMYPYPPYGVFRANKAEFDLMDGILGMALSPESRGDRKLYYHSLASVRESWVPASVLRNERNFEDGTNHVPRQFQMSPEARKSQSVAEAFDKNGILYFGMMDDNSINCWNSDTSFKSTNIHTLEQDDTNLQFASGLKIIQNENGEEELWVVTDRFQLLMRDEMRSNEVNFRILAGKVEDLLRNCPCRKSKNITFPDKTETARPQRYTRPSSGYYG